MKFDSTTSKPFLRIYKNIVAYLPLKKKRKLIGKAFEAFSDLSYYASMGFPPAMVYLGTLYENGYYVSENRKCAIKLYKKACKSDYPLAYYRLGCIFAQRDYYYSRYRKLASPMLLKAYSLGYYKAGIRLGRYIIDRYSYDEQKMRRAFNILQDIWETYHDIDARCVMAIFYFKRNKGNDDLKMGEDIFRECITKYKSVNTAITWIDYAKGAHCYSPSALKNIIRFIESNIPSITSNKNYWKLRTSIIRY